MPNNQLLAAQPTIESLTNIKLQGIVNTQRAGVPQLFVTIEKPCAAILEQLEVRSNSSTETLGFIDF